MKKRGFEIVKGYENKNINIPVRKTSLSAGYDIEAAEDIVIPSFRMGTKPTLIKTGLKCYMENDEYLMLVNRSSNPVKRGLVLANKLADHFRVDRGEHIRSARLSLISFRLALLAENRLGGSLESFYVIGSER